MERLTKKTNRGYVVENYVECAGTLKRVVDRLAELEDKLESGLLIELPNGWLDTLKLLTCAAMCYADIESMIANGMKDNEELANLFFSIPRVQGSVNDIALKQLAESKIDCDKIKGVEEVLNVMPIFKRRFQDK